MAMRYNDDQKTLHDLNRVAKAQADQIVANGSQQKEPTLREKIKIAHTGINANLNASLSLINDSILATCLVEPQWRLLTTSSSYIREEIIRWATSQEMGTSINPNGLDKNRIIIF